MLLIALDGVILMCAGLLLLFDSSSRLKLLSVACVVALEGR